MRQKLPGIALNGASSQYDRLARSVEPNAVRVDARTFTELLSFGAEFAGLVTFYELDDRPNGDWTLFFLTDPTMILASIEALNLRDIEQQFRSRLKKARETAPEDGKSERLRDCSRLILDLARQADAWRQGAQMNPYSRPARLFATELVAAVDTILSPHLHELITLTRSNALPHRPGQSLEPALRDLSLLWGHPSSAPPRSLPDRPVGSIQIEEADRRLETIFRAFLEAFRYLQKLARQHLPATLLSPHHKPQIALYIAFVQLFARAQDTLNTLTGRFSDFYYSEILRAEKAEASPACVYLTLALHPTAINGASLPAGTQFSAGKEADGSAILYASDQTVALSAAKLLSLQCLRVVTGPVCLSASTPSLPASPLPPTPSAADTPPLRPSLRQVLGTEINVSLMDTEATGAVPPASPLPWPSFGETALGTSDIATTTPVTLGFAVASPYLMLTGGERSVTLNFQLRPGDPQSLASDLTDLANATGLDTQTVFEQVVGSAFDLWLTTTAGWFRLASYACSSSLQASTPGFALSFALPADAPPIVAFFPPVGASAAANPMEPDSINPAPELPSLKAYLRQTPVALTGAAGEVQTFPLSLLAQIGIERIEIQTTTANLTNFQVATSTGAVNTSKPFALFGGGVVAGSYLQFSNAELFVKQPDSGSLAVNVGWYGLPQNSTGFQGYYQGYLVGVDGQLSTQTLFDNCTFQGKIQVINPGTWAIANAPLPGTPPPVTPSASTTPPPNTSSASVLSPTAPSSPLPAGAGIDTPLTGAEVYLFRAGASNPPDCSNPVPTPDGALCAVSCFGALETTERPSSPYYDPTKSALRLTLTAPPYAFGSTLYAPSVQNAALTQLSKADRASLLMPGCRPLSDAAESLDALDASGSKTPPSKSSIRTAVQQIQQTLLQAAQNYLSTSLGQLDASLPAWVQQTFTVSGAKVLPPYVAQTVNTRLQTALQSIGAGSIPAPLPIGTSGSPASPPNLPPAAAGPLQDSINMLQGVIWMQQALDQCAAEPESSYPAAAQTQLSLCAQRLRTAYSACMPNEAPIVYPNPPWMPQAQALSVDYSAHGDFSPSTAGEAAGSFFYLPPTGGYESAISDMPTAIPFLPIPTDSSLELCFSGLTAAQPLNMLVQMVAGGRAHPPKIVWQYRTANDWTPFDAAQISVDTTNGLQNSGLLTLNLPQAAPSLSAAASPADCRRFRAVTQEPEGFPEMIWIHLNPVQATWVRGSGGGGQHLNQPLPPNTITQPVQKQPAVKTVRQPVESFGGQPAEDDIAFQMRISERLRHKGRAVLPWDYELLVLQQFSTIWKVQALPATDAEGDQVAGSVLVVVVAGPQSAQVTDPAAPLVSSDMLAQIKAYLTPLAGPFADIQVVNPVYIRITVTAEVIFQDSEAGGSGIKQLNSDLIAYLSPWPSEAERASSRGNYTSQDAILQFIQTRPYVAAAIRIHLAYDPSPSTRKWYFLTSAQTHVITEPT